MAAGSRTELLCLRSDRLCRNGSGHPRRSRPRPAKGENRAIRPYRKLRRQAKNGRPRMAGREWQVENSSFTERRAEVTEHYLDGNALAGPLREIFTVDTTAATCRCVGCGLTGPVAALR